MQTSSIVAKYKDLTITEGMSCFYIYHKDGRCSGMSDGVDMFTDEEGKSIWPGTPEFYKLLNEDLKSNYEQYLEAYFPET